MIHPKRLMVNSGFIIPYQKIQIRVGSGIIHGIITRKTQIRQKAAPGSETGQFYIQRACRSGYE